MPTGWVRLGQPRHRPMLKLVTVGCGYVRRHRRLGATALAPAAAAASMAGSGLLPGVAVEGAVPSPLAGHAVNPSLGARWRHPCRHTVPQAARTPHQRVGRSLLLLKPCTPTFSTGPCPPTVAGPYAAWMPRKRLQERTCDVSCDGGRRARALQQTHGVEGTARTLHQKLVGCFIENRAHRPSRLALARPPSRDLTRHGCRVRAYKDVLAACPAMVGGQGPCSQATEGAAPVRQQHPSDSHEGAP